MRPYVHYRLTRKSLTLGNFTFVMGKDIVHPAGMNIEMFTKILNRHCRAFDVPARKTLSPRAGPFYYPALFGFFPQGKVPGVSLQGVRFDTDHKDAFRVSFDRLEAFEFDYIEKNLELKISGGRRYNFRPQSGNPDDLLVFQQQVTAARQRLAR